MNGPAESFTVLECLLHSLSKTLQPEWFWNYSSRNLPFKDDSSPGSDHHLDFCEIVHTVYNESLKNSFASIGENCSTNKAFARKVELHFIGCHIYLLNFAVKDILA